MKKLLLPKKCWLPLALVAVLAVGCGLKIATVEFSTHEPMQETELTVKTTFVDANPSDNSQNPQGDYYLMYAIRVPNDWAATELTAKVLENDHPENVLEMIDCEPYAKYCQYCFPLDGYKWIAFQSKDKAHQGHNDEATIKLTVGTKLGDYRLDVMAGGWQYDPSELLNADGNINLANAFGQNLNREEGKPNTDNGMAPTYFKSSEYLYNASTISQEEYQARIEAMKADKSGVMTLYGLTLPVAPDIANVTNDQNMKVTVKENPNTGIEGVDAEAANAPAEYFDLQGRKVATPEAGLYLVKRGNKVTKELLK